jgi:hypothetical protein
MQMRIESLTTRIKRIWKKKEKEKEKGNKGKERKG